MRENMCIFGLFSIYNKFKYRKWIGLTPGKRQQLLEKVEAKQAKKLGRSELPVVINHDPNWHCYGMFEVDSSGRKLLYLSINLIDNPRLRYHALETILHEGRHAYQYEQISKKKISPFNFKAKKWRDNYSGYITSREDRTLYSIQPIERDAQKYAIKEMEKFSFKFRNEEDYQTTMRSMLYRFEESERQAKRELGFFYKMKMNRRIKDKSK